MDGSSRLALISVMMDPMTLRAAVVTEKGGVGKTTVTLGLASAARAAGDRVLVVDLDPQASTSLVLGVDPAEARGKLSAALDAPKPGGAAGSLVQSCWGPEVVVMPAGRDFRQWQNSGTDKVRANRLERSLRGVADLFDLVLIDCPPGLGDRATMALTAADRAVMVAEPSVFSVDAIAPVADLIDEVWQRYNDRLDLAGVIINRMPAVSAEAERQYEAIAKIVGRRAVWKPVIPQRVAVSEAAAQSAPIHALGARGADVAAGFDQLYRKLKRS